MLPAGDLLALLDWRRTVGEMYARVRAAFDPQVAWSRWCSEREHLFLAHPQSPLPAPRGAASAPVYFDYDPRWRLQATLHLTTSTAADVPWSAAQGEPMARCGEVVFALDGEEHRLAALWLSSYAGGLLVAFRDATSGAQTYGGGRYLLDTAKGADLGGHGEGVVLDFNFAYNPSCAYDPRWSCPLATRENTLAIAVTAGERLRPADLEGSGATASVVG